MQAQHMRCFGLPIKDICYPLHHLPGIDLVIDTENGNLNLQGFDDSIFVIVNLCDEV